MILEDRKFYTVRGYQLLEQSKSLLTPSLEDYLEMIYRSITYHGYIRVNELASDLNVKPSSVSKMITKLAELGLIDYEKYGVIQLTDKGTEIGKYLLWRHNTIYQFFDFLSSGDRDQAFKETELVEHILSRETVNNMEKLLSFFSSQPAIEEQLKQYSAL